MREWMEYTHFGGFDWADDHHDVVIVDAQGKVVKKWRFGHGLQGWKEFGEIVAEYPNLAMAVETSYGLAVTQLLNAGVSVYPVNPHASKQYRQRKAPSGTKTDALDAWALADALRVDGQHWRPLSTQDPLAEEIKNLCRDEVELIEQRTAFINQLISALKTYYPAALEAFEDWTLQASWAFITAFPTPQDLEKAGKRKWEKFLHTHRIWREQTAEKRYEIFAQATLFCGSQAAINAKSQLALTIVKLLQTLEQQLKQYRSRIMELFNQHPDHDLFGSLPGAGDKIAPRLFGEIGVDRSVFEYPQDLQCYGGSAPISYESGQIKKVKIRRQCNKHLRCTLHQWAGISLQFCAWARAYYDAHRSKGQSHSMALRCLANRWLKILWKMWQSHTTYNEVLHTRNQIKHGSWILQLNVA
jgi:transposase